MEPSVAFYDVSSSDEHWDKLSRVQPLWVDRFGSEAFYEGGVMAWDSPESAPWDVVIDSYLTRYAPHVPASDFEQVINRKHQLQLLRTLYVFGHPAAERGVRKVADPAIATVFARELTDVLGSSGELYSNTSHDDPFEDAPEYDLSSAGSLHLARCACVLVVNARYVGRIEVLFDDTVNA